METIAAKQQLESFINEMVNWEKKWGNVLESNPDELFSENGMNLRLDELVTIQNKYLSSKALSLQQDRRVTLSFTIPPEYNQVISEVTLLTGKKVEICTKNDEGDDCRIYTLILEGDAWKVDIMKIDSLNWRSSRQVF
ncbi:NTF2 fold immunity protein [Acinetobacter gerneri]|jgi:hypothetical protein|uniref:NTF2 fold immunity protein n=1 Tax=Acinetobacter gerneri TaxID=202952 RepID=UPI0023F53D3D|nr:NTF2 fold immunity protein [Acinetobacter gerneri]MCH4243021.1 RhsIA family immunity protein [Acinetobacter gerneri]